MQRSVETEHNTISIPSNGFPYGKIRILSGCTN